MDQQNFITYVNVQLPAGTKTYTTEGRACKFGQVRCASPVTMGERTKQVTCLSVGCYRKVMAGSASRKINVSTQQQLSVSASKLKHL